MTEKVEPPAQSRDMTPTRSYSAGLREGVLRFLRCTSCEHAIFYPRILCPRCGGTSLNWESSAGHGSVYSITEVPGDADRPGYNIALIDLDEGFRLASTVLGSMASIGDGVRFDPAQSGGETPRPIFVPSGERG